MSATPDDAPLVPDCSAAAALDEAGAAAVEEAEPETAAEAGVLADAAAAEEETVVPEASAMHWASASATRASEQSSEQCDDSPWQLGESAGLAAGVSRDEAQKDVRGAAENSLAAAGCWWRDARDEVSLENGRTAQQGADALSSARIVLFEQ